MPFGGLVTAAAIGAGGGLLSSIIGSNAATKASQAQVAEQEKALQFQQGVYQDNKTNQAPFVGAGQASIQQLMDAIKNGQFGPGSLPAFTAPTLDEARATPGYQFAQQQGEQGIERGAAAAGGAFTGGTLKSLAGFDTGLADSTYNNRFAQAYQTYQTVTQAQQQEYNQLAGVASLGENAAANAGNAGIASAGQIGNTLENIGNSTAAGIIGSTNAINNGIASATSSLETPFYLQYLKSQQQGQNGGGGGGETGGGYSNIGGGVPLSTAAGLPGDFNPEGGG